MVEIMIVLMLQSVRFSSGRARNRPFWKMIRLRLEGFVFPIRTFEIGTSFFLAVELSAARFSPYQPSLLPASLALSPSLDDSAAQLRLCR